METQVCSDNICASRLDSGCINWCRNCHVFGWLHRPT